MPLPGGALFDRLGPVSARSTPAGYSAGPHLYATSAMTAEWYGSNRAYGRAYSGSLTFHASAAGSALEPQQRQTMAEMEFAGGPAQYAALQFAHSWLSPQWHCLR